MGPMGQSRGRIRMEKLWKQNETISTDACKRIYLKGWNSQFCRTKRIILNFSVEAEWQCQKTCNPFLACVFHPKAVRVTKHLTKEPGRIVAFLHCNCCPIDDHCSWAAAPGASGPGSEAPRARPLLWGGD